MFLVAFLVTIKFNLEAFRRYLWHFSYCILVKSEAKGHLKGISETLMAFLVTA